MESLKEYVISVVAAALICAVVINLTQKSTAKDLIKLLCGLFLAFTAIRPITRLDFNALTDISFPYGQEAEQAAALGENMARQNLADIIKAETEAYILDKAAAWSPALTVEVTVSGDNPPVPTAAVLCGEISPYARRQLEEILQTELGIAKENQLWTG